MRTRSIANSEPVEETEPTTKRFKGDGIEDGAGPVEMEQRPSEPCASGKKTKGGGKEGNKVGAKPKRKKTSRITPLG